MDKESVNRRLTPDSDRKSDLEKEDTLNVSGLSIGMTVKNYKVLCRLLGQETTTGKAKQYQFEYYGAAEPPVRCGESHLSGLTEPPHFVY